MDYIIAPQSQPTVDDKGRADFILFLIVSDTEGRPVMVIEVKNDFAMAFVREAADAQLRQRLRNMFERCPNEKLYGLSVLGPRMRLYECVKATDRTSPPRQTLEEPDVLPPDYLKDEWSTSLLSPEGLKEMQRIVAEIRSGEQ